MFKKLSAASVAIFLALASLTLNVWLLREHFDLRDSIDRDQGRVFRLSGGQEIRPKLISPLTLSVQFKHPIRDWKAMNRELQEYGVLKTALFLNGKELLVFFDPAQESKEQLVQRIYLISIQHPEIFDSP